MTAHYSDDDLMDSLYFFLNWIEYIYSAIYVYLYFVTTHCLIERIETFIIGWALYNIKYNFHSGFMLFFFVYLYGIHAIFFIVYTIGQFSEKHTQFTSLLTLQKQFNDWIWKKKPREELVFSILSADRWMLCAVLFGYKIMSEDPQCRIIIIADVYRYLNIYIVVFIALQLYNWFFIYFSIQFARKMSFYSQFTSQWPHTARVVV